MDSSSKSLSGTTLTSKPSTAFSTSSSNTSGSRLLFGEVNSSCNQSFASARSTCGLILCSNPSFLEFWSVETCRQTLLHLLTGSDLSALRLVCHGISERVINQCFSSINLTFRAKTFSKPTRLAALHRIGPHIKQVTFRLPRSMETTLPPLIDPWTGEQKQFGWKPLVAQSHMTENSTKQPRYGDAETTELLIRQYPPLFHAATNVQSFVSAISCLTNLQHLRVSCAGEDDTMVSRVRGIDIMEIALTSLVHAVEEARLKHLDTITLSNIRLTDITALSSLALSAHPSSLRTRSNIHTLNMSISSDSTSPIKLDQIKLLRNYIRSHKTLHRFSFHWLDTRGPSPLPGPTIEQPHTHPAYRTTAPALFPHLEYLTLTNTTISTLQLHRLIQTHKPSLRELDLENVVLADGTWESALSNINGVEVTTNAVSVTEEGDVPIMLAPSICVLPSHSQKPNAGYRGQASEASKRVRRLLLADERQVQSSTHQSRKVHGRDGKRKEAKEATMSPVQQLTKKCGGLFGWRMKSGPTLVVG